MKEETGEEDEVHPSAERMPHLRPSLTLVIVSLSVFAIWEAVSFLDLRVLQAEVDSEHIAAHQIKPPNSSPPVPIVYKGVPTESSKSIEENGVGWMQRQEHELNERRLRVETVCEKYKDVAWRNKHVGKEFLFDLDNGLACCRHGKAST